MAGTAEAVYQRTYTHHMFALTLRRKYGERIFRSVSKEICLRPTAGEDVPPRVQERAEQMAHSMQSVFSGMDFFTRMQLSPMLRPAAFMQACIELGLRPSVLTQTQCETAQRLLDEAFEAAAERHESPVSIETGLQWLKHALRIAVSDQAAVVHTSHSADVPASTEDVSPSNASDVTQNDPTSPTFRANSSRGHG